MIRHGSLVENSKREADWFLAQATMSVDMSFVDEENDGNASQPLILTRALWTTWAKHPVLMSPNM